MRREPRRATRPLTWLLALLVLVAFAFQGTRGIWEPDEGRYASAGIHMQESGDWLVPTVDGEHPHLSKPPMTYWALAASFALMGHNEWAARLPGALAFVGTGLFVFGLGRRLCPARPWLPAVVWALSLAPAVAANVVSTDSILALFETAAMYAFVEARSGDRSSRLRRYALMWLAWGLAFMTKGPPGLLPLLGVIAFLMLHDRSRLKEIFVPAGLGLFVVVGFTWFAVIVAQQPDRLGYFFGYEMYERVFTAAHDRNSQWYGGFEVYVPMLLVGTLPWSVLALLAAGGPRPAWRRLREQLQLRDHTWLLLAYWLLVPLVVFFVARSRLHLYLLPLYVPLAIMMARVLARWPVLAGRRLVWTIGLTTASLLALKITLAYWTTDRNARDVAAQVRHLVDMRTLDEIVFVGMRPLYGLNLYLDRRIAGIQIDKRRFAHSKFVPEDALCDEIAGRARSVYGTKRRYAAKFLAGARRCGATARFLGYVHADGFNVEFFRLVLPGADPANSG